LRGEREERGVLIEKRRKIGIKVKLNIKKVKFLQKWKKRKKRVREE
jgi:hypothetical protein